MRQFLFITLILCSYCTSMAATKPTKAETVKWLQGKLAEQKPAGHKNFTPMCVDYNLQVGDDIVETADFDKKFKTRIVSHVSWSKEGMAVQNHIYAHGKLRETYTYQVPLNAIASATVTNCKKNSNGNVNAYAERPIFITVKKNTTRVGHISYDKNGKSAHGKANQYHMNSGDADWESAIPIAGNWDQDTELLDKILVAFNSLTELR